MICAPQLRPGNGTDRPRLREILLASGRFSDEEIDWAMRLVASAVDGCGVAQLLVAEEEGEVIGWAGWQDVRGLPRTSELCWISIDPRFQRRGVGSHLMEIVEQRARESGAKWLLVETRVGAGDDDVRGFYQRRGYGEVSRIVDFHRRADDRHVLIRCLDG